MRRFDAARQLSTDPASTILEVLFLPNTTQVVVLEPNQPQLVLVPSDQSAAPQRLDSLTLPFNPSSPAEIYKASDESAATIVYDMAATYVSSDGVVHGPYGLATLGFVSVSSVVTLEQDAGAVLLGMDQDGPAWATLGPGGLGRRFSIPLGFVPDPVQPPLPLWDDGTGGLSALLPISYGGGANHALFVMRGHGGPVVFGPAVRLDLAGQTSGFAMTLGPSGETGVLLGEGPAGAPQLSGWVVTGVGTQVGGLIANLTSPVIFPPLPAYSTAWSVACGYGGGCDPTVRFDGNGGLIAGWTVAGQLGVARLPAHSSAWRPPSRTAGGPLTSPLAVDGSGDVSALAMSASGPAVLGVATDGAVTLSALATMSGLSIDAFTAATRTGGGAFWGTVSTLPSGISSWTFNQNGAPIPGTGATLALGELPVNLRIAAQMIPSSAGSPYLGQSVPGWMLIDSTLGSARDLLLATYDPSTGALGLPASIAAVGWQQVGGVVSSDFTVDPQGDAFVWFSQALSSTAPPNLLVSFAPPTLGPGVACLPLPSLTAGSSRPIFVEADQRPYGPTSLTGSGRILVGYDGPVTTSLAR